MITGICFGIAIGWILRIAYCDARQADHLEKMRGGRR